jgi:drug/metabolite transporter (DMT)-like permease
MFLGVLSAFISAIFQPFYSILAKKGANPLTVNFLGVVYIAIFFSFCFFNFGIWVRILENWELIFASGVLHIGYIVITLLLIKKHEFQVVYPLTRLAPILILFGEIFLFGTDFSILQILGVSLVVVGTVIFGVDEKIAHVRKSVFWQVAFLTLFCAAYFITDKKLISIFSPAEAWALVIFQLPIMFLIIKKYKKELKEDFINWKNTLGCAISMGFTWYATLFALKYLDATIVASIRNLSILFGVFLGAKFFNEGYQKLRYVAAVLIVIGAFLVL